MAKQDTKSLTEGMVAAGVPSYMHESLLDYLQNHQLSDDFLEHVLCNDLKRAVLYADDINQNRLPNYVRFLFNYAPIGSWGSVENVKAWLSKESAQTGSATDQGIEDPPSSGQ